MLGRLRKRDLNQDPSIFEASVQNFDLDPNIYNAYLKHFYADPGISKVYVWNIYLGPSVCLYMLTFLSCEGTYLLSSASVVSSVSLLSFLCSHGVRAGRKHAPVFESFAYVCAMLVASPFPIM